MTFHKYLLISFFITPPITSISPSLSWSLSLSFPLPLFVPLSSPLPMPIPMPMPLSLKTRWAWGREEISQLEKNLAPRVIPTYCLLRVLMLCCMSWMLLILNTIAITLVPIMMGRMFFHTAQIPQRVQHDPVAYIVGACVCLTSVTVTRSFALICLNAQKVKGLIKSAVSIPLQATLRSESYYDLQLLYSTFLQITN